MKSEKNMPETPPESDGWNPTAADLERLDNQLAPVYTPPDPMRMVAAAIDKGMDPQQILDFIERVKKTEAAEKFALAMNQCQQEMPTVVRDKMNTQTNKKYAPVESIQAEAKPVYSKHGFSLSFTSEAGSAPELTTMHLDVTHVGGHVKRCTLPNVPLDDKGPKGGDVKTKIQGLKSSMSYAKNILICLAFNITVADEDKDGVSGAEDLTPSQLAEVNAALKKCAEAGNPIKNLERWLDWLDPGLKTLKDMPQRFLQVALNDLARRAMPKGGVS